MTKVSQKIEINIITQTNTWVPPKGIHVAMHNGPNYVCHFIVKEFFQQSRRGGRSPLAFFENRKKCPGKTCPVCVHLCSKFSFKTQF